MCKVKKKPQKRSINRGGVCSSKSSENTQRKKKRGKNTVLGAEMGEYDEASVNNSKYYKVQKLVEMALERESGTFGFPS